jgi:hypothetical protein
VTGTSRQRRAEEPGDAYLIGIGPWLWVSVVIELPKNPPIDI